MNTKLIWGLQLLLAIYFVVGAVYMMQNYLDLASVRAAANVPATFWIGLGSMQILFAIGLVLHQK